MKKLTVGICVTILVLLILTVFFAVATSNKTHELGQAEAEITRLRSKVSALEDGRVLDFQELTSTYRSLDESQLFPVFKALIKSGYILDEEGFRNEQSRLRELVAGIHGAVQAKQGKYEVKEDLALIGQYQAEMRFWDAWIQAIRNARRSVEMEKHKSSSTH